MKIHRNSIIIIILNIIYISFIGEIPLISSSLTCPPDYKSQGDNYSSMDDPQDNIEYLYGYEFAHKIGSEYYDHWKGVFWDNEDFCYDAYDNTTRPTELIINEDQMLSFDIISNINDADGKNFYILIEHEQSNLLEFHKKMCMTETHQQSLYNHGEYELLIKMDSLFEDKYIKTPYHFYFTIENPYDYDASFCFKVRNFINTIETIFLYDENDPNNILDQWEEEYPIPEIFYLTDYYSIKAHKSLTINVSLTFEKNSDNIKGGYFIISDQKGKSPEPFYWPTMPASSEKLPKLTNMEIILESNNSIGVSSFALMKRREKEENSFLGEKCNVESHGVINGKCGDGFFCNKESNGNCKMCDKKECKQCDLSTKQCTQCFLISVEGQYNPPGGKSTNLNCDLDYIDITKVKINGQKKIEVPPAIHWRVTMDFWIWISDTSVLSDAKVNMNIVYKDFMAITLKCFPEGLRIYATPIEWLYEYPTFDEEESKTSHYYKNNNNNIDVNNYINADIVEFLKEPVGSYGEVTLEDLIKKAASNWVYIRYAFNLDSSKHYLNDLPENNLKVAQIYSEQTGMPFHMKKFYGLNDMTYLYFQNFYHPLTESQVNAKKKITIYLRNLNIFREYMPQKIITKYYNLHLIDNPLNFPQLLASFPFSDLTLINNSPYTYKMKGYNYFVRKETGEVIEDERKEIEYNLILDNDVKTLRPPRNFWRLNLLNLNEQPTTCDFNEFVELKHDSPNDICFEDNKPFICDEGTDDRPYYLDINNLECRTYCDFGYMHPPRYSLSKKRLYCSYSCDAGSNQCPSDDHKYTDIYSNFLCSNNFFNLYYKCFNKNEALNNADFTGIFFSSVLRTPSIYIQLPKYTEFAVDFWYFPDDRLRMKRYLSSNEENYDSKKKTIPENENNKIIFLSDCCKISYQAPNRKSVIQFYVNNQMNNFPGKVIDINPIEESNWNHLVLTYFKRASQSDFTYYLTFNNDQYHECAPTENDPYQYNINYENWIAPSDVILSQIIFCNKDQNVEAIGILKDECKAAVWRDGFYRKLQIFNIRYSAKQPIFSSHQFEDDGLNDMLRHRFIFGLDSIIDNHLIDLIGNSNGKVSLVYDSYAIQNPDKVNYILYEVNFAPKGGISNWDGIKFIKDYEYKPPKLEINSDNCNDIRCSICQSKNNCLECKEGYSLFDKGCKGDVNKNLNKATYFYKNPGINMPERLSLNLDFNKIIAEKYFTIFFFIKIYGFVKDEAKNGLVKLLIFHQKDEEDSFYLAWDSDNQEKLSFYVKGERMFSYEYFREYNFGLWIPISFTAFREEDRRFKMNMVQASILYKNLKLDDDYINNDELFPYVQFTQFTITNKWVGLLSDIKIYNKFIPNAWGIIKHKDESISKDGDDIPDSVLEEINLKSDSPNSCLLSSQILNQPSSKYKVQCVADYNPHLYKQCSSMEYQTVKYEQGSKDGLCTGCCPSEVAPDRCLGGHDKCGKWSDDHSCENQSPIWKTYYLAYSEDDNERKIVCKRMRYIDYNRYKYVKVNNVYSPQDVWAIDFWFKTSTNQAVKERQQINLYFDDNKEIGEINNNNFNEFIIEWNYHIKIRVYKKLVNEKDNKFSYFIECSPIVVLEHSDLNSDEIYSNNLDDVHYKWTYVACGVNFIEKVFYMTNNNKYSEEKSFTSKLELIPSEKTTLSIIENSRTGYGFTLIYQLRLWHCYNCAHQFRNLDYSKNDKNFNAVYHNFDGTGTISGDSQIISDEANNTESFYVYQAADFPGYTLNYDPDAPVLCDESIYQYYSEEKNECQRHYNIARSKEDKKIYIPSSRNGRYTMDFWFYVENSAELSPGVNLFWENHMSITIMRDTSNKNTINAICFPQSYRDNVDEKGGQDIIDIYDKALNKDKYSFYQGSSMWNFVRCAVDQTRKKFYINDNLELDLEGEILYGTTRNYRPFRYFKINSQHELKFQNARFNPTRIFLRQIKCYREYIAFNLMELKYKACGNDSYKYNYWFNCRFYPLVFCFDYGELIDPSWYCTDTPACFFGDIVNDNYRGLVYHIFPENKDNDLSGYYYKHWRYLLKGDSDPYYPTFPDIYLPNFCIHGQQGGDKEECSGDIFPCRLRNSTAYFWPNKEEFYIDLNNLTQVNECHDACRPPDSYYKRNYCLIKKDTNNMINCASKYPEANQKNYYTNYECKPGYVRVYYECIDSNTVSKSAMYFSNIYSFPNVVFYPDINVDDNNDYNSDWTQELRLPSYYVEIWMKLDAINNRKILTEIEHYLLAYPHRIIKDPVDQKFKYSNLLMSQGTFFYNINSINNYEWNKIIIENLYDYDTKKFSIKLYINFEFDNPEITVLNIDSNLYKLHFRGFGFCDKPDIYCKFNKETLYIRWGIAWYRNFRVWDADITSLQSIQECENGYTELIHSQKYYFPLTVDYIERNTIKDKIDSTNNIMKLNYWTFYNGQDYEGAFDNAMRENYSIDNFDKTDIYENNYISGLNEDGTDYLISSCAKECKRCYSSSKYDCYECRTGYVIYGKQCKVRTGYYFKTPPKNSDIEKIEITSVNPYSSFELEKANPLTITLYIKFFGIELSKVKNGPKNYYILVCFYVIGTVCKTYIGYNYKQKAIVLIVNEEEIFFSKAKNYIGIWTHFGISVHRQKTSDDSFPHMLNFMIDQKELIPKNGFKPTDVEVKINTFTIYTDPICYYSSFKVFSTFYFGPYGHVNAISSTRGNKLIYQVNLYGSSKDNCISDTDLMNFPSETLDILKPVCVPDYLPYEDSNNICSDNSHFMDVKYEITPPCEICDSYCITNCFDLESSSCSCDYNEGLYWIKTYEDYQSYECEKVDSINFAFYNEVNINGLKVVKNDEMSIVFWLRIYEYLYNKFDNLEIIWNQHLAVIIKSNKQGTNQRLNIECHCDYDVNNINMERTIIYDNDRLEFNKWYYIKCKVDKYHKLSKINDRDEQPYTKVDYENILPTSFLRIVDKTDNFNYGYSFIRELKLFSSYNFDFWDDSYHNIQKKHFDFLLHHFSNIFNENKLSNAKIRDQVEGSVYVLSLKNDRIGYNYVIGYEKLIICEEGYVYNENYKRCDIVDSLNCKVPRNMEDKCLLCSSNAPYLDEDDICLKECKPKYFKDDYFKQCRKCHETCYTCFGKNYDNCLSCEGEYYYIPSQHICVTNCEKYHLVISSTKENTCEDLLSKSYITSPVYLNNSYDYNPSNEDYKSKIVNRDIFSEIEGHLGEVSSDEIKTKWIYNRSETLKINKLIDENDFPEGIDPIISDSTQLKIEVNNEYFKYGYKYVFNLEIYSEKEDFSTTNSHQYIIMMNDYPLVGKINILPSKGYITNIFLITINNCIDDVSEKSNLNYKFTYFKKSENIIKGNNPTSEEEILIKDWSSKSEVLIKFDEINTEEDCKYYIRGYCKDQYDLYYSEIQEVQVFNLPTATDNTETIYLKEVLSSIDLNEELNSEQLLNRAEMLSKMTVDFDKGIELADRINITSFNQYGVWQQNLRLTEPQIGTGKDIFCNNRGVSYLEYFYLICDCSGFDGNMCQIDHSSYDFIIDVYKKLFLKVKSMQTGKYNKNLIQSVNLLMKSGASFMDINHMDLMLESIEFINLYRNRFSSEMIDKNNYQLYFDIYNSLIQYGLSLVNKLKYKNFISKNSKNAENEYNREKIRNATLTKYDSSLIQDYFTKIKTSLQSLLEFYASNKKQIRFINKNINIYIALIDEDFDVNSYFEPEKKLYEPYMNFQRCLERTMIQREGNPSYRVYLSSIIWKVSPYMSDINLYWNTSSPIITFKFLDYDTGEKLHLSDCGNTENQIELYFPVNNYNLMDKINKKRNYLSPENQYGLNDDIFMDPVYINKSGAVFSTSVEERRKKYFLGFNFSCKYYKVDEKDKNNIILSADNLDFHKYTKENYIQCLNNKLIQEAYEEFVVDSFLIEQNFRLSSRFFYLKHYKLLSWKENYNSNQAFYFYLILSIIYLGVSLSFIYFEKLYFVKKMKLSELKLEIIKINLPYRDEYLFNNDLLLGHDIKNKFKEKRKPNMEEMNLDTNALDVEIMADEIGKHAKGFKSKENYLNFNPEFFGIKTKQKFDINTKFFPGENYSIKNITNNDEEISQDKFNKLKNYYQVGFKGLSMKENSKKELKLSKDKKNIIINKIETLEKISENQEELDIEPYEKNFFQDDNEFNEDEKDISIDNNNKKTRNEKYNNNMKKYHEFATTNEGIDPLETETQLKSSKREKTKKKFFGTNPPKKTKDVVVNSYVFNNKEQQKIAKSNSAFFENQINKHENNNKNKTKKNILQNSYDNIYKPNFKGPKVIGENLGFFNKADDDGFEHEKNSENINTPYYGTRLNNKKKEKGENKNENTNAEMRVGFKYKNRQVDLTDNEEKLPALAENLNFERRMEEFHEYSIYFKQLLIKNIKSRYILITTFYRMSIVYDRYMKVGNFYAQLSMYAFFWSIFLTSDEDQAAYASGNGKQIIKLILLCFLIDILGCILAHLPAYFFWVNDKKFRKLYNLIRTDDGINILKGAEDVIKKGRIFWNILGVLTQLIYIIIGFYFSFCFCSTYHYQRSTFCLGLILTCAFDFIISEPVWEIIIGFLFYIRDAGRIIVFFGTLFNTLRNIKHLV